MTLLYEIIEMTMLVLMGFFALYITLFAISGHFYRYGMDQQADKFLRIAVLVPGYKEDGVILEAARSALTQHYPMSLFDVVIIADSFELATLEGLRSLPVKVIEVSFERSTKAKALNQAMEVLGEDYDIAVVLDADNLMDRNFLSQVNQSFQQGYKAVQGHRTAKNLNNSWAILDAISEEINNHVFRKGHRALGLSSAIIGSGMAFDYPYFKHLMSGVHAVGGFDKEIELKMLAAGDTIGYLDHAMVYDEKVQASEVFTNQRRRWLAAQFHYFRTDFAKAFMALIFKGKVDYFDKTIQFILPPRILLVGAILLSGLLFGVGNYLLGLSFHLALTWGILLGVYLTSLLISVPRKFYGWQTVRAVAGLPKGMMLMALALLRIRGVNKTFLHTPHTGSV
ncbi:MAG: glycosyltransferase family 2 protein, partial [Bacteroidota bacterium]|nr:glycosyltransferase family 2 protein [Bacteroidota bacterium]